MKIVHCLLVLTSGCLFTGLGGCHRHEPLIAPASRKPVHAAGPSRADSRLATATLVNVLADRGVSLDAPVMPYLPGYWHKAMFMNLTFRDFLRFASGKKGNTRRANHWASLTRLAKGYGFSADNPAYDYTGVHDPFFRVLVAGLSGYRWSGNADTDQRMANLYFDAQARPGAHVARRSPNNPSVAFFKKAPSRTFGNHTAAFR